MATQKKLEEKHQKILHQLQALPENKSCAECSARGPGFVNLFNNSFVCMKCSGLLREFNHRIKSVSAAVFTPEEIKALQEGGNQGYILLIKICHDRYLATFKPSDHPNGGDTQALKDWMRLKYVTKKWYRDIAPKAINSNSIASIPTKEHEQQSLPFPLTRNQLAEPQPATDLFAMTSDTPPKPTSVLKETQYKPADDLFSLMASEVSTVSNPFAAPITTAQPVQNSSQYSYVSMQSYTNIPFATSTSRQPNQVINLGNDLFGAPVASTSSATLLNNSFNTASSMADKYDALRDESFSGLGSVFSSQQPQPNLQPMQQIPGSNPFVIGAAQNAYIPTQVQNGRGQQANIQPATTHLAQNPFYQPQPTNQGTTSAFISHQYGSNPFVQPIQQNTFVPRMASEPFAQTPSQVMHVHQAQPQQQSLHNQFQPVQNLQTGNTPQNQTPFSFL